MYRPVDDPDELREAKREHAKEILEDPRHDAPPPGKEPRATDTPDERGKPQPDAT